MELSVTLKSMGYPESAIPEVMASISRLDSDLYSLLIEWLQNGVPPAICVAGVSASDLVARKLNPVATMLTLDWLRRDPERAKRAIGRKFFAVR